MFEVAKEQLEQSQEQLVYERKANKKERNSWDGITREDQEQCDEEEASEPSLHQEWPSAGGPRREEPPPTGPQPAPFEGMMGTQAGGRDRPEKKGGRLR